MEVQEMVNDPERTDFWVEYYWWQVYWNPLSRWQAG